MNTSFWDGVLTIDFCSGDQRFYRHSGLSDDRWTVGPKFEIDLGQVPARRRGFVRLRAVPFQRQQVRFSINGTELGTADFAEPATLSWPLPASIPASRQGIVLTMEVAKPLRPCDTSDTTDDRPLGVRMQTLELLGTNASDARPWPDIGRSSQSNDQAVLSCFESLGDNCEFGFVQKRTNVTATTLLKFSATPVERLIEGLTHGFNGITDPDGVMVVENGPEDAREYQVVLPGYGLHYHTLVFTHQAKLHDVRLVEIDKLRHKHAKFLGGLSQQDRIYVLKKSDGLSVAQVWTVWLLLQRFGPNTLLWVRRTHGTEPPRKVRILGPGLLEATIPSFAPYEDATLGDDASWIAVCREVLAMVTKPALAKGR